MDSIELTNVLLCIIVGYLISKEVMLIWNRL